MATRVPKPVLDRQDSRKRVFKACERCRMKKIKCEGVSPCQRCLAEDGICVFGRRRQGLTRMVTSGYVENLEMQQRVLTKALKAAWRGANPDRPGNLPVHAILEELGLLHGIGGPDSLRASFETMDKDDSDEACSETHAHHEHGETAMDDVSCCEKLEDADVDQSLAPEQTRHNMTFTNDMSHKRQMSHDLTGTKDGRMRNVFSSLSSEPPALSWRDSSSTISTIPSIASPMSAGGKRSASIPTLKSPVDSITSQSSTASTPMNDSINSPRRRSSQKPTFCPMPPKPVFPAQLQPAMQPLPEQHGPFVQPTIMDHHCMSLMEPTFSSEELDQIVKQEACAAEWAQQWNIGCQDADSLLAAWPQNAMDLDLDLDLEDDYQRKTFNNWLGAS